MIEFEKYITEYYNVRVIKAGISHNEGFYYILQLNPNQQYKMNSLEKCHIEQFIFKAKMTIVESIKVPLAQISGTCIYSNDILKLTGSKEFIELMLKQLFNSTKQ